jgi:hypothetical protein
MKYRIKKILKKLGIYSILCIIFLPKRKFIVEPFVYLNKSNEIVTGKITDKVRWLEKFEYETECEEFAEAEFWKIAKNKYTFYKSIWLF